MKSLLTGASNTLFVIAGLSFFVGGRAISAGPTGDSRFVSSPSWCGNGLGPWRGVFRALNLRMVRTTPFKLHGGMTAATRLPSGSRESRIGCAAVLVYPRIVTMSVTAPFSRVLVSSVIGSFAIPMPSRNHSRSFLVLVSTKDKLPKLCRMFDAYKRHALAAILFKTH